MYSVNFLQVVKKGVPLLFLFLFCAPVENKDKGKLYDAYYNTGLSFLQVGDYSSAIENFMKAENIRKDDPKLYNAMGLAYMGKGLLKEAESYFEKALKLNPDYSEARNNLGVVLYQMRRYDEAIREFERVLSDVLYKTPQQAYLNLGLVYFAKGEMRRALFYFKKAISIDPNFALAYANLGFTYFELKSYDEAEENLEQAKELLKKMPGAELNLAEVNLYLGRINLIKRNYNRAVEFFEEVIRLAPGTNMEREAKEKIKQIKGGR